VNIKTATPLQGWYLTFYIMQLNFEEGTVQL